MLVALSTLVAIAGAQTSCSSSCAGTTSDGTPFDLSALRGQDYQTKGSDEYSDTYFLSVCGTSVTQCPHDAGDPPVTQGTAVQTVASGGCYVLGVRYAIFYIIYYYHYYYCFSVLSVWKNSPTKTVFSSFSFQLPFLFVSKAYTGDNCLWTANPGGQEGIQLVLDNGSNNLCGDGSPRQVTIAFICPNAGSSGPLTPNTWTAVNLPGSCEYAYTFETCAACTGGCKKPAPQPICCQAKPEYPQFKGQCIQVKNKTNCISSTTGYGKTCEWTCGECDALKGDEQYQKFCHQHNTINSCNLLNATCEWVPSSNATK